MARSHPFFLTEIGPFRRIQSLTHVTRATAHAHLPVISGTNAKTYPKVTLRTQDFRTDGTLPANTTVT
jgi:hypothetical protein